MSGRLRRKGLGNVLAACGVAAALAALPTAAAAARAPAAGGAIHGPTVARSLTTSTYWTAARLRQAKSLDVAVTPSQARALRTVPIAKKGLPGRMPPHAVGTKPLTKAAGGGPGFGSTASPWYGSASSAPATTSGRVFFTGNDGLGYSCSGSTVNSAGKNLVFTAGHCVHPGGTGTWHANWVFIPGYNNGYAPYGTWSARQLWSWNLWTQNGDRAYDIGVAVMNTDGWGRHIVNVVGGQGIEWNYPLSRYVFQYGYPARAPFNGGTLQYCSGWTYNDWGNQGINCTMTEGASGGPWLDNFNGSLGWLDSVNSWVFWDGNGFRYKWNGPYFGNDARDLFNITGSL